MTRIRVLATEDDPIQEEKLRMDLDKLNYDLIDVVADPHEVLSIISATNPDILLMDIDLNSDISGIELVEKLNELFDIPTVFLTSFHDQQTFDQAKETQPAAYIVKPYETGELQRVIELTIFNKQRDWKGVGTAQNGRGRNYLFVKDGSALTKLLFSEISMVEAYDKYCYIHTSQKKFMIRDRLKNVSDHLPRDVFVQVHRSYIVNYEVIDAIYLSKNKLSIGGREIGIGKTYRKEFLSRISTLG